MGRAAYRVAVLADAPQVWWECLEGAGTAYADSSGNGNNGTQTSPGPHRPYRASGGGSGAYGRHFQGGEGFGGARAGASPTDDLSLETWVWVSRGASNQKAVYVGNNAVGGYSILVLNSGTPSSPSPFVGLCGGVAFLAGSTGLLTAFTWNHIVLVRAATVWTYYLNGAVDTANAGTTTPNAPTAIFGGGDGTLEYVVSNPAFYPAVLSAARVKAHYDAMVLPEAWAPQQIITK